MIEFRKEWRLKLKKRVEFFILICLLFSLPLISSCFKLVQKESETKKSEKKAQKEEGKKETPSYIEELSSHLSDPPLIYVAKSNGGGGVSIINSQNDSKASLISLKDRINIVAMKPDGSELYATSSESNKIFIIDLKTKKIAKTIESEDEPFDIAFHPDGSKAYVTHYGSQYVSVIDTQKKEVVKTIQVGKHPASIAITFDGKKAYVGHSMYISLKGVKKRKIRGVEVPIGMPEFSEGSKILSVIDLDKNAVVQEIPIKGHCSGIAVRPDDAIVYVTVSSVDVSGIMGGKVQKGLKDSLAVIDTSANKITSEIEFDQGSGPKAVAFTPDMKKAYAICGASDSAYVVDAKKHKILRKIPLGLGG
jgi:YVTN family beta-propeller protein